MSLPSFPGSGDPGPSFSELLKRVGPDVPTLGGGGGGEPPATENSVKSFPADGRILGDAPLETKANVVAVPAAAVPCLSVRTPSVGG